MSRRQIMNQYRFYGFYRGIYYSERLVVNLEGGFLEYTKTLSLLAYMDLSGNNLYGHFPTDITNLVGLVLLNLSRNQIDGPLPNTISSLRQLGALDVSNNRFSGVIPSSLSSLTFLSRLDLSNNNFSGRIPVGGQIGTFKASVFAGNPYLCGPPLAVNCNGNSSNNTGDIPNERKGEGENDNWFLLSIGLGFATGILVPWLMMSIRRPWGESYFRFVDNVVHRIEPANQKQKQHK